MDCDDDLVSQKHILKQTLVCTALDRLRWSLCVCFVSKSPTEMSIPIGAFMELHSNTNVLFSKSGPLIC